VLPNNPRIRAALYLATFATAVISIILKHVAPGPWADASLEVGIYLAGPTGLTALTNILWPQTPQASANRADASAEGKQV
jgi:hypothetical protein